MEKVSADQLRALAEKVMAAPAAEQQAMMFAALDALRLPSEQHFRAVWMIEVGAYESAAVSLVPEGWVYEVGNRDYGSGGQAWCESRITTSSTNYINAATPALALTAAALLARAAMMESNDGN